MLSVLLLAASGLLMSPAVVIPRASTAPGKPALRLRSLKAFTSGAGEADAKGATPAAQRVKGITMQMPYDYSSGAMPGMAPMQGASNWGMRDASMRLATGARRGTWGTRDPVRGSLYDMRDENTRGSGMAPMQGVSNWGMRDASMRSEMHGRMHYAMDGMHGMGPPMQGHMPTWGNRDRYAERREREASWSRTGMEQTQGVSNWWSRDARDRHTMQGMGWGTRDRFMAQRRERDAMRRDRGMANPYEMDQRGSWGTRDPLRGSLYDNRDETMRSSGMAPTQGASNWFMKDALMRRMMDGK